MILNFKFGSYKRRYSFDLVGTRVGAEAADMESVALSIVLASSLVPMVEVFLALVE